MKSVHSMGLHRSVLSVLTFMYPTSRLYSCFTFHHVLMFSLFSLSKKIEFRQPAPSRSSMKVKAEMDGHGQGGSQQAKVQGQKTWPFYNIGELKGHNISPQISLEINFETVPQKNARFPVCQRSPSRGARSGHLFNNKCINFIQNLVTFRHSYFYIHIPL